MTEQGACARAAAAGTAGAVSEGVLAASADACCCVGDVCVTLRLLTGNRVLICPWLVAGSASLVKLWCELRKVVGADVSRMPHCSQCRINSNSFQSDYVSSTAD